jgi:hypothetical protein
MHEIIFMVHEPPEGGYAAEALGHSIYTGGDTLEELREMVRDAVVCHFDDNVRPKIIRLHSIRHAPPHGFYSLSGAGRSLNGRNRVLCSKPTADFGRARSHS